MYKRLTQCGTLLIYLIPLPDSASLYSETTHTQTSYSTITGRHYLRRVIQGHVFHSLFRFQPWVPIVGTMHCDAAYMTGPLFESIKVNTIALLTTSCHSCLSSKSSRPNLYLRNIGVMPLIILNTTLQRLWWIFEQMIIPEIILKYLLIM